MCADWITMAMEEKGERCGFDAYERALIAGGARMLRPYNDYYMAYLAAVQDEAVASALQAHPPAGEEGVGPIFSHYTVVRLAAAGPPPSFTAVPFAEHFREVLGPVLAAFDSWVGACAAAEEAPMGPGPWDAEARRSYTAFLRGYRACLAYEAAPAQLEAAWADLGPARDPSHARRRVAACRIAACHIAARRIAV
jgi:hypothetical protein